MCLHRINIMTSVTGLKRLKFDPLGPSWTLLDPPEPLQLDTPEASLLLLTSWLLSPSWNFPGTFLDHRIASWTILDLPGPFQILLDPPRPYQTPPDPPGPGLSWTQIP